VSDPFDVLAEMSEAIARLHIEIAGLRYAQDRTIRHGKVTDVDTKKQLARIEIGEKDEPVKSAWLPYGQFAGPDGGGEGQGEYKFHNPPFVGQQMTVFSPNGELRQGVIMPFTWHDKAKSPSDKADEHVITYGKLRIDRKKDLLKHTLDDTSIEQKPGSLILKVGETCIEITPTKINIHADTVSISGNTYTGQGAKGGTEGIKIKLINDAPAARHWAP